ncbi:MAG: serine/threonine-protein phosphatase [Clostridia bacterium]|nr:serine/threonine-protein phosphatase [Clostridia bacterium]
MNIDFYVYTNTGDRTVNEDAAGVIKKDNSYCFYVADGLGGHKNGAIASQCVRGYMELSYQRGYHTQPDFLEKAFEGMQRVINLMQEEKEAYRKMKTTAAILTIKDGKASWGHIGDSRVYYFKNKSFVERSFDHSVPQMLAFTGEISEEEIAHHPDRSKLFRALGMDFEGDYGHEIDHKEVELNSGDVFLLCSDGFWEWMDFEVVKEKILQGLTSEEVLESTAFDIFKCRKLSDELDNLSAVMIRIM